jgi:hypothetical protein
LSFSDNAAGKQGASQMLDSTTASIQKLGGNGLLGE